MADGTTLVTGALGQDGWLLAERLAREGHRVIGVVRPQRVPAGSARPEEGPEEGPDDEPSAPFALAGVDLGDGAAVRDLVARTRPDRIFHIAAVHHSSEATPAANARLREGMTAVNFLATTHLIQAILADAPACRLVYAASSHMHRPGDTDRAVAADSPRDPPTWYGLTKSWSMEAIAFARRHHGLHGSAAVLFNHESERRPVSFVSRKIAQTAARIRLGLADRLELLNIGARADWFDAHDAVDAMIRLSEADEPADAAVGSGRLSCVRDMVEEAFATVDLDWRQHVVWREDSARPAVYADIAHLTERLGWRPRTPIRAVLRRMVLSDLAALEPAGR